MFTVQSGIAGKAIPATINAKQFFSDAGKTMNSGNSDARTSAWNYVCTVFGGSACVTLVLTEIIALFRVLTLWFWIQLPVSLVLIFLLFVFEMPLFFQHVLTLCGNKSELFEKLQQKVDSMQCHTQIKASVYIVLSIVIIASWRQVVWGAIIAIICGILHFYIYHRVNGKSAQPPQPAFA